ncbi:F-box protein CPR1 [Linum grandiflorum]
MTNILLRLRVKDLVSCRRVSKQWLSIIDDPHFIRCQLECSLSTNTNAALFLQHGRAHIFYWRQKLVGCSSFFSDYVHRCPSLALFMGSCHGLVCFCLYNYPHEFIILNPSTGEQHTLNNPAREARKANKLKGYGFGYDELSDDYKMVWILETIPCNGSYIAEIFGVRSKDFSRTIPLPTSNWKKKQIGLFFGSSLHWCTLQSGHSTVREHVIHAIDLVSNTYRQLQLPKTTFGQVHNLNLGIVDRCLCLCGLVSNEHKIGIWVMEEYGNLESLNRIYYITYGDGPYLKPYPFYLCCLGNTGEKILLIINQYTLASFDPTKKNADGIVSLRFDMHFRYKSNKAIWCQETLVKIFPNDVKKDAYDKQLTKNHVRWIRTVQ